ncbi:MAG: preprotein translocase subunit SecY [Planctomycetota bacterium]|nr:preprotein translocase subunit SecY [Planctomycetota bacterium]
MAYKIFRQVLGLVVLLAAAYFLVKGVAGVYNALNVESVRATALTGPITQVFAALVILAVFYFVFIAQTAIKRVLENIFSVPDLLKKIAFTVSLLCIYRVGFWIPLPGLNQEALSQYMQGQAQGPLGQAMEYFAMFTGGNLQKCTLFGLGIMPYISASIIFQLLITVVPALEKLQKEGQAGQKKIQEYTRYATVLLCIIQAVGIYKFIMKPNLYSDYDTSTSVFLMAVLGLTAGTIFLMWLGEQIDEYGVGNGISLIIMAGIIARMPAAISDLAKGASLKVTGAGGGEIGLVKIFFLIGAFVLVVAGSILITQAQRRIPIQQAKHTRGRRVYGGQRQYLPLRVNHGGVMPIIFASSLMMFPNAIAKWADGAWHNGFTTFMAQAFDMNNLVYQLVYVGMIFFFAYFWTTVQFRPKDMSDQLRDNGSFIPGLRPGKRTADYLERVMERITYCGAGFLAAIAVIPQVITLSMGIPFGIAAYLGGTGLLIMVSVALDLVQRIEAELIMRNYGGFLSGGGRIKGARG